MSESRPNGRSSAGEVLSKFAYNILDFADWNGRCDFPFISKSTARSTVHSPYHYRWLCEQLKSKRLLHVPSELQATMSYRDLFFELWNYRDVFVPAPTLAAGAGPRDTVGDLSAPAANQGPNDPNDPNNSNSLAAADEEVNEEESMSQDSEAEETGFTPSPSAAAASDRQETIHKLRRDPCEIAVAVRFRPASKRERANGEKRTKVVLPLYQRLQLIRAQQSGSKKSMGIGESLQVLKESGEWFGERWAAEDAARNAKEGNAEQSSKGEKPHPADQGFARVETVDPSNGEVVMVAPKVGLRRFKFQSVLPSTASQTYVYDTAPRQLIMDFLNGFNASIVVYGQTGSGKTFTMFGKETSHHSDTNSSAYIRSKFREFNRDRGVVIRACEEVFQSIKERKSAAARNGLEYNAELSVTYVEIFGDEIIDLLDGGDAASHTKVAAAKFVLAGENRVPVADMKSLLSVLEAGERRKRTAATAMNERSSRAHTLFIVTLKQTTQRQAESLSDSQPVLNTVESHLFLADLGGSEQVKKSLVKGGRMDDHIGHVLGDQMREAVYINLGLFALKKCIRGLNRKQDYIPYQDSKLTRLLQDGLGGDAKSMVIICASMDEYDSAETLQALRFGEQCQRVKNEATVGQQQVTGMLQKLDARIAELEDVIRDKEHWEVREIKRVDDLVEQGTYEATLAEKAGGEVVRTTVLVGAEAEREELVDLLQRRAALAGEKLEVGQMYGVKPAALSGNATHRYAETSKKGLVIKGKQVAEWTL